MARHPGMQHNNRMRELADKITWANLEAMGDGGDVKRLKEQLKAAEEKAEKSDKVARALAEFQAAFIRDVRYGGITDWGLPGTVTLTRWEEMVCKPSDSFYWDQYRDKFERPGPETAPAKSPQTLLDSEQKGGSNV